MAQRTERDDHGAHARYQRRPRVDCHHARGVMRPVLRHGPVLPKLSHAPTAPDPNRAQGGRAVARLSPRERELVGLVAGGFTDAQIAERLFISVRTVRSHLDRIRDKSGARRRAELTRLASAFGLIKEHSG